MAAHPTSLEALDADPAFPSMPTEVRQALLSASVDPERRAWSAAAVQGIALAVAGGAVPVGLANDDVVELTDPRGERFGLVPIAFEPPAHPLGSADEAEQLLRGLDRVFAHRAYIVAFRRPVPPGLEIGPICSAVQLWLAQLDRTVAERHATYEDDDVSLDLTLVDGPRKGKGGRVLTVGPVLAMEQLGKVDGAMLDAASRCEESLGRLPLVMVAGFERAWRVPRGFVQQLLYGTPDVVRVDGAYEAEFTANGRSLFSDVSARTVAALWWTGPSSGGRPPVAYDNPWAGTAPALSMVCRRFSPSGEPDRRGRVTMRWHPAP